MKKVIIVLALVAMAVLPIAAKGIGAIGVEAGYPATGVTFDYKIDNKWDGYATVGLNYGGALQVVVGGQYKAAEFKIEKAKFDVNVGAQAGAMISSSVVVLANVTGSISYDFKIKDLGSFTTYLRLGIGAGIAISSSVTAGLETCGALGLVYHL